MSPSCGLAARGASPEGREREAGGEREREVGREGEREGESPELFYMPATRVALPAIE